MTVGWGGGGRGGGGGQVGDVLVRVGGQPVTSLEDARRLIVGEAGTPVALTLRRSTSWFGAETLDVVVRRGAEVLHNLHTHMRAYTCTRTRTRTHTCTHARMRALTHAPLASGARRDSACKAPGTHENDVETKRGVMPERRCHSATVQCLQGACRRRDRKASLQTPCPDGRGIGATPSACDRSRG